MVQSLREIPPLLNSVIELFIDRFIEFNCDSVEEMFAVSDLLFTAPNIISIENENPFVGSVTTTKDILEDLLEE